MISMTPEDVTNRLVEASKQSDLTTDRLATKIDMSPHAITARLREASDLYVACVVLRGLAPSAR